VRWIFLFGCAALLSCGASSALAQGAGTDPKKNAEEYDVHGHSGDVAIGAEFMIHSFSGQGQMYMVKDFLVVEVALFPPKDATITVNQGRFALRVNGKRPELVPAAPQMIATMMQHPEWDTGPRLEGGGGMGPAGVVLGRPRPSEVPGGQHPPVPTQPRAPAPDPPGGIEPEPRIQAPELVLQTALPQGPHKGPISGFLYFPYKGRSASIKSVELLYEDAVLKLR
jgi:hypothetical protein